MSLCVCVYLHLCTFLSLYVSFPPPLSLSLAVTGGKRAAGKLKRKTKKNKETEGEGAHLLNVLHKGGKGLSKLAKNTKRNAMDSSTKRTNASSRH